MAVLCNSAGHYIFALWFVFLSFFFFFFPRLISVAADWMSTILPHMEMEVQIYNACRSEMCCTRLAGNTGRKKIAIFAPSHNFVGLYLRN